MMSILKCEQLSYQYPEAEDLALENVSVTIERGSFVLLLGASGSGKSTFLRALNGLVPRFYGGKLGGKVLVEGREISTLSQRELISTIGFLQQDPERQLLLDTVERELAFGMENMGVPLEQMKSRLAEISQLFGLGSLLQNKTASLSGGEKQRIALASMLALYPQVLLLDEPTSQLDPVHAEEVFQTLRRLNEEWGLTVILSEHRLERCFHLADQVVFFDQGRISFQGTPREFVHQARDHRADLLDFLPPITHHFIDREETEELPLTVKEARSIMRESGRHGKSTERSIPDADMRAELYRMEAGKAGYEKRADVLRNVSFRICEGDHIALFGENGTGKSTLAKVLSGIIPLSSGKLVWQGNAVDSQFWQIAYTKIGYLSQNPNDYFLYETVESEIAFSLMQAQVREADRKEALSQLLDTFGLSDYRNRHPHDLSGGERQRLALAIVLASRPQLLLLDEPTRGLDYGQKLKLIQLLRTLPVQAVLVITHDVEFAAMYANRIAILYAGTIVADALPHDVFSQSFTYMPQVYKLYRE